ncbi:galanin receptor type 2 [Ixodes scapularis]
MAVFNDCEFLARYCFAKVTVTSLLKSVLLEEGKNGRGLPVPPIPQLLIALQFYGAGAFICTVAKMVMVVAAAFALSWTPYFLVSMVTQFGTNYLERQNYFFTMLSINLLAFLNSCVNPFIYAAMSSRFRAGFRRILHPACGGCHGHEPWTKASRPTVPACTSSIRHRPRRLVNGTSLLSSASSGSQTDTIQNTAVQMQQRIGRAAKPPMPPPPPLLPCPAAVPGGGGLVVLTRPDGQEIGSMNRRRTLSDTALTTKHQEDSVSVDEETYGLCSRHLYRSASSLRKVLAPVPFWHR